jgi:hypothetical protein
LELASRDGLYEALHLEVVYADDLWAKSISLRKEVCKCRPEEE